MPEDFDYEKLADLIAKQMKSAQVDGGTVKHLSDLKLEELEKRMNARLDALEKENRELRNANAELYAAAAAKAETPKQEEEPAVSAMQAVKDPQAVKAEEDAARSYEKMYESAVSQLGFKSNQADGM